MKGKNSLTLVAVQVLTAVLALLLLVWAADSLRRDRPVRGLKARQTQTVVTRVRSMASLVWIRYCGSFVAIFTWSRMWFL